MPDQAPPFSCSHSATPSGAHEWVPVKEFPNTDTCRWCGARRVRVSPPYDCPVTADNHQWAHSGKPNIDRCVSCGAERVLPDHLSYQPAFRNCHACGSVNGHTPACQFGQLEYSVDTAIVTMRKELADHMARIVALERVQQDTDKLFGRCIKRIAALEQKCGWPEDYIVQQEVAVVQKHAYRDAMALGKRVTALEAANADTPACAPPIDSTRASQHYIYSRSYDRHDKHYTSVCACGTAFHAPARDLADEKARKHAAAIVADKAMAAVGDTARLLTGIEHAIHLIENTPGQTAGHGVLLVLRELHAEYSQPKAGGRT